MSVRTLALGALMLVGAAGVAAAQSTATPTRPDSGAYRRGPRAGGEFRARKGGRDFYADLNLTAAQKAQIKTIREKYKTQFQSLRTQQKPLMDAARAARQKGDTAAFRSNMQQVRALSQPIQAQESSEIRSVLTPEQQTKFDARQKEMANRRAMGGKGWKKGEKGVKKGA